MPLNLQKRCLVCQAIEAGDDQLLTRLYKSSYFLGQKTGESVRSISKDYAGTLTEQGIWRHLRAHQFIEQADADAAGKMQHVDKKAVRTTLEEINHTTVRDLILKKGHAGIKSGKIKLKASDVRAAAKDASDIEERTKDRSVEIMGMIMKVASGEITSDVIGAASNPNQARTVVDVTT